MKILIVNKFLYPKGGSETYIFKIGDYLSKQGNQVEYFGMENKKNIVGNRLNIHTKEINFHVKSLKKLIYPLKVIYSFEAQKKIKRLLRAYQPDIVHINNINFQITPSILYVCKKLNIPVVMTIHDLQLACPNHTMYIQSELRLCEECKNHKYINCIKNKCIHNSKLRSIIGAAEAWLYYKLNTYKQCIDKYIAPSEFIKEKLVSFGEDRSKFKVITNFIDYKDSICCEKEEYVLYFGRLSLQKGIDLLKEACLSLPNIKFVIAGEGELKEQLSNISNVKLVGFKSGTELNELIAKALFTVCPSRVYDNCPMSVLESQLHGTPVIGSKIGGIPELINHMEDGLLFETANSKDLVSKIEFLYNNKEILSQYSEKCKMKISKYDISIYSTKLINIYNMLIENHRK